MTIARLRGRLILSYVVVLVVGMLAFSAIAVFTIDQTLRYSLDSRLDSAARATLAIVDVRGGRPVVDAEDRGQFLDLLGVDLNGVVDDANGHAILSNVSRVPPLLAHAPATAGQATFGRGDSVIRAQVAPIMRGTARFGSVIIWRSSAWIDETELRTVLAFIAAATVIAILGAFAGNAVAQSALDEALDRQRRFTADASHELRAPLAVITAEADFALGRETRSAGEYRVSLRAIQGEAQRMETLVGDLLSTARGDEPRVRCTFVDLDEVLSAVRERLEAVVGAAGAGLTFEIEPHARAYVDDAAFPRALLAVVHNAAKFARSLIEIRVRTGTHHTEVAIADDGPGFTELALEHATERFWREDRTRTTSGNGLGLSIARATVEHCGGSIAIENRPEGGAIVRFRLRSS